MALKRKAVTMELAPLVDERPSLPSRTRKRLRDSRPDERTIFGMRRQHP